MNIAEALAEFRKTNTITDASLWHLSEILRGAKDMHTYRIGCTTARTITFADGSEVVIRKASRIKV